ncbi:4-hydroxyphenylpyruvate dioxygenase [Microbacterium sp. BE35]|nr:4-hydroxyphenylpyruvate dioxygenase [Microbacterium sp. BE35]
MTPADYHHQLSQGVSISDMKRMASDEGVSISHLDPLATWAPAWIPPHATDEMVAALGTGVDDFLRIADALECESFTAIGSFPHGGIHLDDLADSFARLCQLASGIRVDLEFIPVWGLPDLASAWSVVLAAGEANGGILLDFWHFFRSGSSLELLTSIPSDRIHSVQACDARMVQAAGRTDWEDLHEDRLPLGAGEFPVEALLSVLHEMDALQIVGPEYFSSQMRSLSAEGVAEVVQTTYWSAVTPFGVVPSR